MFGVEKTNAWFSYTNFKGVEIVAQIGMLDLKLYQQIESESYEILTNDVNSKESKKQYVQINGVINPDDEIDLILTLKNEDPGSTSMYVKFKFEIYARGVTNDILVPTEISGIQKPNENANGFVLDESSGFYYLKNNAGNNVVLRGAKELSKDTGSEVTVGEEIRLMEKFKIPFSSFVNASGGFIFSNSETVYIKLTVIASIVENF